MLTKEYRIQGFTVLELLVVVSIVSVLSQIAYGHYIDAADAARAAHVATDIRNFATAFRAYEVENSSYPAETDQMLPPEMEGQISKPLFESETILGGRFDWEMPDPGGTPGIALVNPTGGELRLRHLDRALDDGNLQTGQFRLTEPGKGVYFFE